MWIIHEHANSSSAIDHYWVFDDEKSAFKMYRKILERNKDFLDLVLYRELYEDDDPKITFEDFLKPLLHPTKLEETTVHLTEDDYIIVSRLIREKSSAYYGRRP